MHRNLEATTDSPADRTGPEPLYPQGIFNSFTNRYLWISITALPRRQISYDAPDRASSTAPSYDDRASIRVCAGSCQGGTCVTTNRSTRSAGRK